ncbi:MFS transporter [Izhakiella australiensis]|uniref:MFS transporter n=1 Tax=Izhakiella australiensis TaxID=1926881 RepID=A0A1S8YRR2_9GAMM|nr:MFS transporter [Izhakiella australiensis]OON41881.1 MFS transporter [Izhakiella australiensis]
MRSAVALGATGFALIAVTYGMARFSWGLMMPSVASDIPFSPAIAGIIAASSYLSYCLSTSAASLLTRRFGARMTAIAAALCAATGLGLLACAASPAMLAVSLFIAGLSAGLASPALAAAVSLSVTGRHQTLVNTVINAGTSAGIILCVPVIFLLAGSWRLACEVFAALALLCLLPTLRYLPACRQQAPQQNQGSWRGMMRCRMVTRLAFIAFISGIASAAWWSFGPDILRHYAGLSKQTTSMLWLVSGGAGILGALTGPLAAFISLRQVYRLSQLCMATPLLLLALMPHFSWWLFPAVALGGAGYVTLSGVLLVCGAASTPASPASGVGVAFFMFAAGQIGGSLAFGQFYAAAGALPALSAFAALALLMMLVVPPDDTLTA